MIQNVSLDLEALHPELVSELRRNLNRLNEHNIAVRREAIKELHQTIISQQLNARIFQQVAELLLKGLLKSFSDESEVVREFAVLIVIELITRCEQADPFLSYVLSVLADRTNSSDLQGIANMPEVMRPPPGQKPKVLVRIQEKSEEVRALYCKLLQKIIGLTDVDVMRRHLEDIINVIRALVMDPNGDIQKESCYTLELACKAYKNILLNYTQTMCKALLLPLVSKKSKIRIAAMQALNAALQCGLWKFNAFVFEDLIGFRDPNSVPIRDFYNPSTNINYLATLIIDPNVRVRQAFMKCLHEWICVLQDKYDHHGKLVPYVLSGLFDEDPGVRKIAFDTIEEIGQQLEVDKEKEFRENKQYAIDASWTWDGKLNNMPLIDPFVSRPRLGSRFFIRGHIRKMWFAIFRQVQDINFENRVRAAKLSLMGVIYTENYMTNHLDKFIPPFITALGNTSKEDTEVCKVANQIFYYLGRYCEYSSYIHIIKAALKGECVQHPEFVKCSFKALAGLTQGNLECVPQGTGLCHKKKDVYDMLNMITELELDRQVTTQNCTAVEDFVASLLEGIQKSASAAELTDILGNYFAEIVKLLLVISYEKNLAQYLPMSVKQSSLTLSLVERWNMFVNGNLEAYGSNISEYLNQLMKNPPTYGDAGWKCIVGYWLLLLRSGHKVVDDTVEVMVESIRYNRLPEMVDSLLKISVAVLLESDFDRVATTRTISNVILACEQNLLKYRPIKKKPKYLEEEQKPANPQEVLLSDHTFFVVFGHLSEVLEALLQRKFELSEQQSAAIIFCFIANTPKLRQQKPLTEQSVRVIWAFLQRIDNVNWDIQKFCYDGKYVFPVVINYLVDKLETMESATQVLLFHIQHYSLVLGALTRCAELLPVCESRLSQLPYHYPNYPDLLEKLFKYSLDEKDADTRNRYHTLLLSLCKKMTEWFRVELEMAASKGRHERQKLLSSVLACCHK